MTSPAPHPAAPVPCPPSSGERSAPRPSPLGLAPERAGPRSAFTLLPEELDELGSGRSGAGLFGALHRPWTWSDEGPILGRDSRRALAGLDLGLPVVVEEKRSGDGSVRCVLALTDGRRVEAVWMPRSTKSPRVTLCLSSQVGCAMGCTFCATGAMGIVRNLSADEIVGQALALCARFGPVRGHELNLVFMGMGEPLHNLDHLEHALVLLGHPAGLGIAERRITVSTSGLVPGIDRLARTRPRPLLALSVNATTDEERARSMPVTRRWGLAELKAALERWPFRPKERVTLEYVVRAGENDTRDDARRLAAFAAGLPAHVNLIPLNEHAYTSSSRPDDEHLLRFADWLHEDDVRSWIRFSRGADVAAACGQLVQGPTRRRAGSSLA